MSKKEDVLERISRSPGDGKKKAEVPPPVVAAPGAAPAGADGSRRVVAAGKVVVRRARAKNEPAVEEKPPATVIRRRTVEIEAAPEAPAAVKPERIEAEPPAEERPSTRAQPPRETAPVAPVEVAAEPVAVKVPEPVAVNVKPASTAPVEPPVEAVEVKPARVEAPVAKPAAAVVPTKPEAPRTIVRTETRTAPVETRPAPADTRPAASADPMAARNAEVDRLRAEGRLGKGVISLPPGYDPNARRPAPGTATARPQPPTAAVAADEWRRRRSEMTPAPAPAADDRTNRNRRGRTPMMPDPMAMRRRPRRKVGGPAKAASPEKKASKRKIRIDNLITVGALSHELGVKAAVVIKHLMALGRMVTVNELLDLETATLIAQEFEYEVVNAGFQEDQFLQHVEAVAEETGLQSRPPIVTIMGHVDHGKTTLLDAIRSAKVASGEAGGITQHIGAYQVDLDGDKITFIDTPGHAAFSAMRARGAQVTDIVVLVVSADDGVQAQTEEAIAHAKAAGVPIVVAVNKMDKPGVSADPIKHKLSELGLQPEDWGGDTMFVPVSALKKQGIDELLEAILLQAEVLELKANSDRHAEGVVIEARVERGRGPVATLLVQKGVLKRGDNVVMGATWGRVRAMMDGNGKTVAEATPSTPVEIFGLSELPETGELFYVVKAEKDARTLAEHRQREKRESGLIQPGRRTAADLFAQADVETKKVLPVVLRCDVQGSLEALKNALSQLSVDGTELRFLHAAVGEISESDVNMVASYGGLLIGFNVKCDAMARQACEQQGLTPEYFQVIYHVIDRVTAAMSGLLGPQYREVKQGTAEVRAVFTISKVGKIAGCYVQDGKIGRSHGVRVMRNGVKVHEGKISTLKRFKEDVRDVASGYECGVGVDGYEDLQVGDLLETFSQELIKAVA